MKRTIFSLLWLLWVLPLALPAQTFVNLTPRAKSMTTQSGELALPHDFKVSYSADLNDGMRAEVARFVTDFNAATGYEARVVEADETALFQVGISQNKNMKEDGGYYLYVNGADNKVTLQAKSVEGFYYAFQTVKKILPANVMAGKYVKGDYVLPRVSITDEPRFEYRGFMLDVARHFFTVEEVKRMLDVMAYYKMNRFHWHLSDDQGWRVEIKKYPKLTSVAATAPNSRFTDLYTCTQYWINKPYGPYFYTQDQIREVVAYAKERHIEIIPEIDMPGHFVAAMAAYPEYSTRPNNPPTIWTDGGISYDVLNVADPQAVQFAKDILAELIELFPYETIHIGGDECPTNYWESNALCQAYYKEQGLTNYRQLQSHFIKEMADFVQSKGRKLAVWNEAITAGNADVETVKSTDALVYCWTGPDAAAAKAKELGLKNIYTPWGPYYINRKQGNGPQDPPGAGDGSDDVKRTYNQAIPAATDYGVQGTFWCEHVSDREYMEWLALPRLIAVAEAGWTPQNRRDFGDFQKRMSADTTLLNYGNYKYCKYHMLDAEEKPDTVLPHANTTDKKYYYRIVSGADGDAARKDRCIELLKEGSPLITDKAGNGARKGLLWTNVQATDETADNYDYQWWSIEADPANPRKYALVCKALPNGSVKADPTSTERTGRWEYDDNVKHYNFVLGTGGYAQLDNGNYYYTLTSDQLTGLYMNSAANGQGLSVNVYNDPADGKGGFWQFAPMENYDGTTTPDEVRFTPFAVGKTYTFTNAVEGFGNTQIIDTNSGTNLRHSAEAFADNAWVVTEAGEINTADGTQVVKLKNAGTGRYMAARQAYVTRYGFPVTVGAAGGEVTMKYDPAKSEFRLQLSGSSLFPLPDGAVNAGSTIQGAAYDAPRLQGAAWKAAEVRVVTLRCVDTEGTSLGDYKYSLPVALNRDVQAGDCPVMKNMELQTLTNNGDETYTVTYKRSAYAVTLKCVDAQGAIVDVQETAVPVGEKYAFVRPELPYYTFSKCEVSEGDRLDVTSDTEITVVYTTEAHTGVKKLYEAVTDLADLKAGSSYVLFDASTADGGARQGYRRIVADTKAVTRFTSPENMDPSAVWQLEMVGTSKNRFKVKNDYYGLYVPALERSKCPIASDKGDNFTFALNADGETWNVKGTNGMYWDGLADGSLVGWDGGTGHPIKVFTYYAQPFFLITIRCVDEDGTELSSSSVLHPAGENYPLIIPVMKGYVVSSITGNETYEDVVTGDLTVTVTYKNPQTGIGEATDGINAGKQSIYDLQGRKLQRIARPGIYIVNGKKVLVK